jgi:hypothetical protein
MKVYVVWTLQNSDVDIDEIYQDEAAAAARVEQQKPRFRQDKHTPGAWRFEPFYTEHEVK